MQDIINDNYALMHGDCLERLESLAGADVDLVLADMPYGTTQCKWDQIIPLDKLWPLLKRVAKKNAAFVFTASQPFTSVLVMSNVREFRYEWIWEKSKATGHLDSKKKPMKAHENVLVFYCSTPTYNAQKTTADPYKGRPGKKVTEIYGQVADQLYRNDNDGFRWPRTVQYFKTAEAEGKVLHPTQKPVDLMAYMIRTYTNPSETVLDFCMGSGTTGVAALQEGRNFIGIERDDEYFKVASERIASVQTPSTAPQPQPPVPVPG